MTPRGALEKRFPRADFRAYFAFLGKRAGSGRHRHHVCPRCEFPEMAKDPANVVRLSYKDHAKVHRLLSNTVPEHAGFRIASLYLSGKQTEQASIEKSRLGGRTAKAKGALEKAHAKLGIDGLRAQAARARAATTLEARLALLAKGRRTQAAAGYPGLVKARAIAGPEGLRAAQAKGQASMAAAGYPNLISGLGPHKYWHVRRGLVSQDCKFCKETKVA